MDGSATSPLRSRGTDHCCVLGGPQTRKQSQRCPTSGHNCHITPAFSGVPKQGDKMKGGPQVDGIATSPLRSRGSHHPCVLGGPHTRRQNERWPTSGQNCHITPAFSGVPKGGDKVKGGPQVSRSAISPLRSRGSHYPCVLGGRKTSRQSQRWPTSGRKCYITPAFWGVPKQGEEVKGDQQVGGSATSPQRSAGSPNKGTKSKVAHKWAELRHHPCVLGGPQTRGQSQRPPTSGRKCYITTAFSGVPKQGDKVKGGPQVDGSATTPGAFSRVPKQGDKVKGGPQVGRSAIAPLRSRGSHHPCVLGGPHTRRESQRCPTSGENCYITLAFSGVPKQGDKVKGAPQVGTIAASPLRSRGSPNKGTKSKVPHKWAEFVNHPCVRGPQTRGRNQRWPTSGRKCYITPAFSGNRSLLRSRGSPNKKTKSKVPHKWAQLPHHPCVLGGPQTRGQNERWPTSGRNCYITPAFSGVPSPLCSRGSPYEETK